MDDVQNTVAKTVVLLSKREGIDKVLKLVRYTSKFLVATRGLDNRAIPKLKALDGSLGTTRKALRLGKFLGNAQDVATVSRHTHTAGLEVLADVGEGVYYFLDQFIWLVRAGVLPRHLEAPLARLSSYAELLGYVGSISLKVLALRAVEQQLAGFQHMRMVAPGTSPAASVGSVAESHLSSGDEDVFVKAQRQLRTIVRRRTRLQLLLLKDCADAAITVQDVAGARVRVVTPAGAAACGITSAIISLWKLWSPAA